MIIRYRTMAVLSQRRQGVGMREHLLHLSSQVWVMNLWEFIKVVKLANQH